MTSVLNFFKTNATLFVILAVLAAISVLAVIGHTVTGSDAYGVLMLVAGGTAVAGGIILGSTVPNNALFAHVILILAVIGMLVALSLQHLFTSTQVVGVFSVILGGGSVGVGSSILTKPTPQTFTPQNVNPVTVTLPPAPGA
jgi:hypothetical protein